MCIKIILSQSILSAYTFSMLMQMPEEAVLPDLFRTRALASFTQAQLILLVKQHHESIS